MPYHSSLSSRSPLYSTASSAVCSLQRDRDVVMDVGPTMSQLFCFFTFYVPAVRMWSHRRFVCMLLLVNQYSQAHNTRTKNSYTHWARTLYVLRTANTRWNVPHTHIIILPIRSTSLASLSLIVICLDASFLDTSPRIVCREHHSNSLLYCTSTRSCFTAI